MRLWCLSIKAEGGGGHREVTVMWWEGAGQWALLGWGQSRGARGLVSPHASPELGRRVVWGHYDCKLVAELWKLGAAGHTDALMQGSVRDWTLRAALLAKRDLNSCLETPRAWLFSQLKCVRLLWHQFMCHANENIDFWYPWSSRFRPKSAGLAWFFYSLVEMLFACILWQTFKTKVQCALSGHWHEAMVYFV